LDIHKKKNLSLKYFDYLNRELIDDFITDLISLAFADANPSFFYNSKVLRDSWLRQAHLLLANRHITLVVI